MVSGYRNVSDPDLTFMTSAELDSLIGDVLDHDNALFLVTSAFQNEVVPLGLLDGQQFLVDAVYIDDHRELGFADLALEFLKVVVLGATDDLFFHLEVDPLGEALEMDCAT
jgi:hypothetical protein